jgi:hypothetical protein
MGTFCKAKTKIKQARNTIIDVSGIIKIEELSRINGTYAASTLLKYSSARI